MSQPRRTHGLLAILVVLLVGGLVIQNELVAPPVLPWPARIRTASPPPPADVSWPRGFDTPVVPDEEYADSGLSVPVADLSACADSSNTAPIIVGGMAGGGTRAAVVAAQMAGVQMLYDDASSLDTRGVWPGWAVQRARAAAREGATLWSGRSELGGDGKWDTVLDSLGVKARCNGRGTQAWGWKEPRTVWLWPALAARYGAGAKFLHVIRDGRDAIMSRNQADVETLGRALASQGALGDAVRTAGVGWAGSRTRATAVLRLWAYLTQHVMTWGRERGPCGYYPLVVEELMSRDHAGVAVPAAERVLRWLALRCDGDEPRYASNESGAGAGVRARAIALVEKLQGASLGSFDQSHESAAPSSSYGSWRRAKVALQREWWADEGAALARLGYTASPGERGKAPDLWELQRGGIQGDGEVGVRRLRRLDVEGSSEDFELFPAEGVTWALPASTRLARLTVNSVQGCMAQCKHLGSACGLFELESRCCSLYGLTNRVYGTQAVARPDLAGIIGRRRAID